MTWPMIWPCLLLFTPLAKSQGCYFQDKYYDEGNWEYSDVTKKWCICSWTGDYFTWHCQSERPSSTSAPAKAPRTSQTCNTFAWTDYCPSQELTVGKYLVEGAFSYRDQSDVSPAIQSKLTRTAYGDGSSSPSGADRPNPRLISNLVLDRSPRPNDSGLSDYFWVWGQILDHDMVRSKTIKAVQENFPIQVPAGDRIFDPRRTGTVQIPLKRHEFDPQTGASSSSPRKQLNFVTSLMDSGTVYGDGSVRSEWLKEKQGGRLKINNDNGLAPINDGTLENDVEGGGRAPFVLGDVRANENSLLTALHTVLLREHNFWAKIISDASPELSDDAIYHKARVMVESIMQSITWNEWLPIVLGPDALPPYQGYRAPTDTSVSSEFSTAAFRLGHGFISDTLWQVDQDGNKLEDLELKDLFFQPSVFLDNDKAMDQILRGAAQHRCNELGTGMTGALRNFLFNSPGFAVMDLASLNIQRARDHGVPDYNTVRRELGLTMKKTFTHITADQWLAAALDSAYQGDLSKVDLWVGAISEDHVKDAQVGKLLHYIVMEQITRLRDGDPLWYENRLARLPLLLQYVQNVKLSDVLERNAHLDVQDHVFYVPDSQPARSTPTTN